MLSGTLNFQLLAHIFNTSPQNFTLKSKKCTQNAKCLTSLAKRSTKYHKHVSKANICIMLQTPLPYYYIFGYIILYTHSYSKPKAVLSWAYMCFSLQDWKQLAERFTVNMKAPLKANVFYCKHLWLWIQYYTVWKKINTSSMCSCVDVCL